ncbi:MAG: PIN domain-containing protein [Nitrososphaerota archaeon]|nr:PIN domain-containing protein [Nitrososphaerota archaeon]
MTAVADTRLLLELEFPADEESRDRVRSLFRNELASRLMAPSIVLSEFMKVAGGRMGLPAARVRINQFKERGMKVVPIDEAHAVEAGRLMLSSRGAPVADALIASFVVSGEAEYVVTDDQHYRELGAKSKWF